MDCKTAQRWLTDQLDGQLSEYRRHELDVHLRACASCRTFEEQLEQLDFTLSLALERPVLSPAFARELHLRINTQTPVWSTQEHLTRKQRLQHDFEAAMAKLNRRKLDMGQLMNWGGVAALGGLGAWLLWQITPSMITFVARGGLTPDMQTVLRSLLPSVVFFLVGLAAAFPASTRRLQSWLEG